MATKADTKPADGRHADPMLPHLFKVDKVRKETVDTFTVELVPRDKGLPFSYEPGQFNMLYVYGVGEVPISISGDPSGAPRLVHTTRVVGAVTRAMHGLKVGDTIGVRGPFGTSWPVKTAEGHDVVILAGGIGLAPLRPALYHVLNNRDRYGKVVLLYGTRSPGDILFRKELAEAKDEREIATLHEDYYEKYVNPYRAASLRHINDIIEPRETRPVLVRSREILKGKKQIRPAKKHGNIPL